VARADCRGTRRGPDWYERTSLMREILPGLHAQSACKDGTRPRRPPRVSSSGPEPWHRFDAAGRPGQRSDCVH
jgi:hypothetical protein